MNNKSSLIFICYALLVTIGFGGTALLVLSGKSSDTTAVVAFTGFYGFLCTTGVFYVLVKYKSALESISDKIDTNQRYAGQDLTYHTDAIWTSVNDNHKSLNQDLDDRTKSIWDAVYDNHKSVNQDLDERTNRIWETLDRLSNRIESDFSDSEFDVTNTSISKK